MDPTEFGAGSAIIEISNAVKNSGKYDPWAPEKPVEVKDGLESVQTPKIKVSDCSFNSVDLLFNRSIAR